MHCDIQTNEINKVCIGPIRNGEDKLTKTVKRGKTMIPRKAGKIASADKVPDWLRMIAYSKVWLYYLN